MVSAAMRQLQRDWWHPDAPSIHPWVSPWRKWAVGVFAANSVAAIIFCGLCITTYKAFKELVSTLSQQQAATGVSLRAWTSLFNGAAVSAGFACVLALLAIALSTILFCFSSKSVAHPNRVVSKRFLQAASWFTGLHVLNIALQFHSYTPLMSSLQDVQTPSEHLTFNTPLLAAAVAFGYINAILSGLFGVLLSLWTDRPDLLQLDRAPAGPA
ncbi:hypothetical protein QJQ45_004019 [Haematococcus lacustris]|nr:hypothetical protein QJQ45_004019 [Haematococcus lacustris]